MNSARYQTFSNTCLPYDISNTIFTWASLETSLVHMNIFFSLLQYLKHNYEDTIIEKQSKLIRKPDISCLVFFIFSHDWSLKNETPQFLVDYFWIERHKITFLYVSLFLFQTPNLNYNEIIMFIQLEENF
jgi:hypothetical protein